MLLLSENQPDLQKILKSPGSTAVLPGLFRTDVNPLTHLSEYWGLLLDHPIPKSSISEFPAYHSFCNQVLQCAAYVSLKGDSCKEGFSVQPQLLPEKLFYLIQKPDVARAQPIAELDSAPILIR